MANSPEKQASIAKNLASSHLGIPSIDAKEVPIQGCYSKTFVISLSDGREAIIQLRVEPLDVEPFNTARSLLGSRVPLIEAIHAPDLTIHKVWPFYMSRIEGATWLERIDQFTDEQQIRCMKSLGRILSQCMLSGQDSGAAVDTIIANLGRCRALEGEKLGELHALIDELLEDAPKLRSLPLAYSHFDLNEMNILTDVDGEITGIVDWEMAAPQPFGFHCACLHYLIGEFVDRKWRKKTSFEAMDRGFWEELTRSLDPASRPLIEESAEALQLAVMIGTVFKVCAIEGKEIFVSDRGLATLQTLKKYRIPAIRGGQAAYAD